MITLKTCLAYEKTLSDAEKKSGYGLSPLTWMSHSRALLPAIYDFKNGEIDQAYVDRARPLVEQQLVLGGLNLAAVLGEIFKK